MKAILVSAAALALLAAPALAQNNEHHDHDNGGGNAPHANSGAANPPHAMSTGHPDRNPDHGNMGGSHPAAMSGPAAQPNAAPAMSMQHNDHNDHRGDNNNNHRNDNAGNNANRGGGMAGQNNNNGMRGPSHDAGHMGGPQPHVTNFNSYHRNFTAPHRFRGPEYRRPQGWYAHRWTFGERLPPAFFVRDFWLSNFFDFGLVTPPYGTTWVRYGSDALLIDEQSGEVIQVEYGVFY